MNRVEAQSHLLRRENQEGAFLIRLSEKDTVGYVLSGKTEEKSGGEREMKIIEERKR